MHYVEKRRHGNDDIRLIGGGVGRTMILLLPSGWIHCVILSEKKIMATMDFFVNKMGWESHTVAKYPHVLSYSLEKKIIPRFSVVRVLVLKGLIEEHKLNMDSVISVSEEYFLNRFVNKYLNQVPQLLDVYQGKVATF
ncbi:hypothetical protein ACLB2K_028753 [Fragaria x ananassa]